MNQLGIAPQCGFASTEEGNEITVDDQRAKLELVVRYCRRALGRCQRLRPRAGGGVAPGVELDITARAKCRALPASPSGRGSRSC